MNFLKKLTYLLFLSLITFACSSEDDTTEIPEEEETEEAYMTGVLVSNEGPFGEGTGTVSFVSEDLTTVEQTIFQTVNNVELGNIVQSIGFNGPDAYIIANNSNKISVANRFNFEGRAVITDGLENPRYFIAVGGKGYVSNWGDPFDNTDDFIAIIDLTEFTVTGTIPVSFGPEQMVTRDNKLYVAHQGGFDFNNVISVINTDSDTVESTIDVGDTPNSMVITGASVWVLNGGKPEFSGEETNGSLQQIRIADGEVTQSFDFALTEHPSNMTFDDGSFFYTLNGNVFEMQVEGTSLPTEGIIEGFFYGITAHEGMLYATDAGDFVSDGTLKVFDLGTNEEVTSLTVGIIPGGVYFNN